MALPAGRVGVTPDSVDANGKVITPAPLPTHTAADAGKKLTVSDDGGIDWAESESELPEYGEEDAGKQLSVNGDGDGLEWKIPDVPGQKNLYAHYITDANRSFITVLYNDSSQSFTKQSFTEFCKSRGVLIPVSGYDLTNQAIYSRLQYDIFADKLALIGVHIDGSMTASSSYVETNITDAVIKIL